MADPLTKPEWRAGVSRVLGDNGILAGAGGPSGINAPIGQTWRQTDANPSHGSLTGLLWHKIGTGTAEGTDWLADYEGRWVSYTPTLTASTTNPTNWTQTGAYTQRGKTVTARMRLVANAGMTAGAGNYRLAVPFPAASGQDRVPFPAAMFHAGNRFMPIAVLISTTYLEFRYATTYPATGNSYVTDSSPWVWAANDEINTQIMYEIA